MRTYICLVAAAMALLAPQAANAYVATTGPDLVLNGDTNGNMLPDPLETFTVNAGSFINYEPTPGCPNEPLLLGNDLNRYRYTFDTTVVEGAPNARYTGTYQVFYDSNMNSAFDGGDFRVSSGNLSIDAVFTGVDATLSGTLSQVLGPSDPVFADLGPTVSLLGTYVMYQPDHGASGILNATLTRSCIPEPASMTLLGTALVPLLLRRRRH